MRLCLFSLSRHSKGKKKVQSCPFSESQQPPKGWPETMDTTLGIIFVSFIAAIIFVLMGSKGRIQGYRNDVPPGLRIVRKGPLDEVSDDGLEGVTEGFTPNAEYHHPLDNTYLPPYANNFSLQYSEGGGWPPNMFSRFNQWQPGYDIAGWSTTMRPGMGYRNWPRNRWVRDNKVGYAFIDNGTTDDQVSR